VSNNMNVDVMGSGHGLSQQSTLSVIGVGVKLAVCLKGANVSYVVNEKA